MASEQLELDEGCKLLIGGIYGKLKELEDSLAKLKEIRSKTIQELEKLIIKAKAEEEAKHHGRNIRIANISGSSAAIAGALFGGVGFGLSFVTFGASMILAAVGAGIGGLGGLTLAGTSATKYFLNKEIFTEVQAAVALDREATKEFLTAYEGIQSRIQHVNKLGLVKDLFEKVSNSPYFSFGKGLKCLGKDIIFESVNTAITLKGVGRTVFVGVDAAADTGATVFRSLSAAGRVVHIGGFAASVFLLPLDIYTVVTESKSFHKGTNEVEERIKNLIAKLELPEDGEIKKIIEDCLIEGLGRHGNALYDIVKNS